MTITTGTRFGHYQITALLGKGGMGEVYLAEDERLKRKVALKLLSSEFTRDSERLRHFEQEAQATSAPNHPNILTIHEIGATNGTHFITTEFIAGQTLRAPATTAAAKLGHHSSRHQAGKCDAAAGSRAPIRCSVHDSLLFDADMQQILPAMERRGCGFVLVDRSEEGLRKAEITVAQPAEVAMIRK